MFCFGSLSTVICNLEDLRSGNETIDELPYVSRQSDYAVVRARSVREKAVLREIHEYFFWKVEYFYMLSLSGRELVLHAKQTRRLGVL